MNDPNKTGEFPTRARTHTPIKTARAHARSAPVRNNDANDGWYTLRDRDRDGDGAARRRFPSDASHSRTVEWSEWVVRAFRLLILFTHI